MTLVRLTLIRLENLRRSRPTLVLPASAGSSTLVRTDIVSEAHGNQTKPTWGRSSNEVADHN
jgi:hypothetical protein